MITDIDKLISEIPELDVLAFAPHPDDAEIFCGGTLAKLSEKYKVGLVDLTRGESSSKGTPELRQKEAKIASSILSLHFRTNLSIPDTAVYKESPLAVSEQIRRTALAIRKSKPSLLLAPYGEARHPDHQGARKLISEALFFSTLKNRYTEYEPYTVPMTMYYMCRTAFTPSVVIDVTTQYAKKMDSISAYDSQVGQNDTSVQTLISHPLSISSITSRDAYYGSMIGVEKGEPFYLDGPIPLKDPVEFIRSTGPLTRFIGF